MRKLKPRAWRPLVAALLAGIAFGSQAAPFPDKPVRVVIGFAPGGNVDIVNRIVAQAMSEDLGQPFVVDNKAGANGAIGAEFVARAASDGYTLFVAVAETHALNPALRKSLPYDPIKDFASIGIVGAFAYVLVVPPQIPGDSMQAFIAYARQNPGKLNFASWGNGSLSQIAMEQLKQATGTDLQHVPFKGSGPAMAAVTAGTVEAFVAPLSLAVPYAADRRVKLLAVTSAKRQSVAPNVPTLMEQGIPVDVSGWNVLTAPAGTPADAITVLNRSLNKAIQRPDVRDKLLKAGTALAPSSPKEAQALVESSYRKLGEVARNAGISPE